MYHINKIKKKHITQLPQKKACGKIQDSFMLKIFKGGKTWNSHLLKASVKHKDHHTQW